MCIVCINLRGNFSDPIDNYLWIWTQLVALPLLFLKPLSKPNRIYVTAHDNHKTMIGFHLFSHLSNHFCLKVWCMSEVYLDHNWGSFTDRKARVFSLLFVWCFICHSLAGSDTVKVIPPPTERKGPPRAGVMHRPVLLIMVFADHNSWYHFYCKHLTMNKQDSRQMQKSNHEII